MQHVNFEIANRPRDGGREPQRRRIDIAPHRLYRCNGTELVEHRARSYITGMEYLIDAV